jgi:hypothetical protein
MYVRKLMTKILLVFGIYIYKNREREREREEEIKKKVYLLLVIELRNNKTILNYALILIFKN